MNSFRFLVISLSSVIQAELIMNSKGPIMKLLAETKVITTNGINAALFSGWKRQHGSTIMKKKQNIYSVLYHSIYGLVSFLESRWYKHKETFMNNCKHVISAGAPNVQAQAASTWN